MMHSVALSPTPTDDIQVNDTKPEPMVINYYSVISNILNNLYLANPSEGYVETLYSWIAGSGELTQAQKYAKAAARAEINIFISNLSKLQPAFILTQDAMLHLANKLYAAHNSLLQACLMEDEEKVKEALDLVNALTLPSEAKVAILHTTARNVATHPVEIGLHGLFGYICKKRNLSLINLFLEAGADMYAKEYYSQAPIFFDIAATPEVREWKMGEGNLADVKEIKKLVTYEQMRKHIHLFLDKGFAINYKDNNENIFEYVNTFSNMKELNYAIYLLESKICSLVDPTDLDKGKISQKDFIIFCKDLSAKELLKNFRHLAEIYQRLVPEAKIYNNDWEKSYHCFLSFMNSLLYFCNYVKYRIKNDFLSFVVSDTKAKELEERITDLITIIADCKLESMDSEKEKSLRNKLAIWLEKLEKTLKLSRGYSLSSLAFFSTEPNCDSHPEWKLFCEDNPEVTILLKLADTAKKEMARESTIAVKFYPAI